MTDIVTDIHDFDLGAFASPEEALAALAGLADDAADEIERLRKALQSSCDEQRQLFRDETNFPCEAAIENEVLRGLLREALEVYEPAIEWYWRVREVLGDE